MKIAKIKHIYCELFFPVKAVHYTAFILYFLADSLQISLQTGMVKKIYFGTFNHAICVYNKEHT